LVGKPEGKRIGRRKRRWKHDFTTDLKETGWEDVDWMQLAQDRDKWRYLVNKVMKIRFYKRRRIF